MWITYYLAILLLINAYTDTADPPDCSKSSCENGECQDNGDCKCHFCWKGFMCNIPEKPIKPVFEKPSYDVEITADMTFGETLLGLKTCPSANTSEVQFAFVNVPTSEEYLFDIDIWSGEISASPAAYKAGRPDFVLEVSATHKGEVSDTVKVHVHVSDDVLQKYGKQQPKEGGGYSENDYDSHNRERRSVPSSPVTSTLDFYMNKTGETYMCVGNTWELELKIHFPPGQTDMLVELFTPDNDTTVMVLCNVKIIDAGNNLVEKASILATVPVYESKTPGSIHYDRAIIDFGNVTNSNLSTSSADSSMITIQWEAVVIPNTEVNGTTFWVSAGAEYNNESEIWVGQASMVTMDSASCPAITTLPTFNMTGPSDIEIGTSARFLVDMYVTETDADLNFDAFAPLNGSGMVSVCSAKVIAVGENFACLFEYEKVLPTMYPFTSYHGNERVRLPMGVAIKKDRISSNMAGNLIRVEFFVTVANKDELIGQSFWIGAALEIGTSQIWAGQILASIITRTNNPQPLPSSLTASLSTSTSTVAIGGVVILTVEAEIPPGSETEYLLEAVMPVNDSLPRFQVCHMSVIFQGENLPCTKEYADGVYTARDPSVTNKSDIGSLDIGRMRNTNHFVNATAYPDANKIRFQIVTTALNHTMNTPGSSVYLTSGLKYNSPPEIWVAQKLITLDLDTSSSGPNMTSGSYPDLLMSYALGDGNVSVGGMIVLNLEITTKPETIYTPMDVEVIVPYISGALYRLCSVEVEHIGKNMPCSDKDTITETILASSKDLNDITDKFTMSMGSVYNIRKASQTLLDPDDDKIRLKIVARVIPHTSNVVAAQDWVSAGILFDPNKLWVGQLAIKIGNPIAFPLGDLYGAVVRQDDAVNNDLFIGQSVRYSIILKPNLYTQGYVIVKASVTATAGKLSICAMRIVSVGDNLGCGFERPNATYTPRAGTTENDEAIIDVGMMSNVGGTNITANETVDNDSLVVDLIVHLSTAAANGNSLTVTIEIDSLGTNVVTGLNQVITAKTPVPSSATTTASIPTFSLGLAPISNETTSADVRPGEVKKFHLDIYFAENSSNSYNIKFLAPVNFTGAIEVCSVIVLSVGQNLPCLRRSMYKGLGVISKRTGSIYQDIGTIDLKYVCQFPIVNDTEENKIRLQVTARVPRHVTLTLPIGQEFWFSSTAKINADQIYVIQHKLSLVNSAFSQTAHRVSQANMVYVNGASVLKVRPGARFSLQVKVTVPKNAALNAIFDIQAAFNGSAVMTIDSVKVNSNSGRNLGCLTCHVDLDFQCTPESEYGTTQTTKAVLDAGIFTNTDWVTDDEDWVAGDDDLLLDIEGQMADSVVNLANSQHILSTCLRMGDVILVADRMVDIFRDNTESPVLILLSNVTNDTIVDSNNIYIDICSSLKHDNVTSSAEGRNVTATFYFPPYLYFENITEINMTESANAPVATKLKDTGSGSGVAFWFDHLYFTDEIWWCFRLGMTSYSSSLKYGDIQDAITPYEAFTNMIHRANNDQPEGHFFTTMLESLTYQVIPSISVQCVVGALGMQDGSIGDCQISGSYTNDPVYVPGKGRIGNSGWRASNRGNKFKKHFQVYFGNITKVTQVRLENAVAFTSASVTKYSVYSSNDGFVWTKHEQITPGALPAATTLSAPAEGRYFRLVIDDHSGAVDDDVGLKMELDGCYSTSDVAPADVCKSPPPWYQADPPNMYRRGYIVASSSVFYCDTKADDSEQIDCFSSSNGATWEVLDQSLLNVIGFNPSNSYLYGLSKDKRTYLLSEDVGKTWVSISKAKYDSEVGLQTPTQLPWVQSADFRDSLSDPAVTFRDGNWGAHYKGLYYNSGSWNQVTDWATCCP